MGARGRRPASELDIPPPVHLIEPALPGELPPPPDHLSPAMQSWWTRIVESYELDVHHLRLLECACDAWDRMVQARERLRVEGLTIEGPRGRQRHPCADIEKDSRSQFARLVRELDLDEPPPRPGAYMPQPPPLRSNRRR